MNKTKAGFGLALLAQVLLLVAIPRSRVDDATTGHTIWLQARASERHDVMQGQYLNLNYEISDPNQFAEVSELRISEEVYAIVRQTSPGVWSGLRVAGVLPTPLPEDHVAILGTAVDRGLQIHAFLHKGMDGHWTADSVATGNVQNGSDHRQQDRTIATAWVRRSTIAYRDIELYFVPESWRQRLAEDLRAYPEEVFAQVRVSESGRATLLQVRIQDRVYAF